MKEITVYMPARRPDPEIMWEDMYRIEKLKRLRAEEAYRFADTFATVGALGMLLMVICLFYIV